MITEQDLQEAIAECEGQRNPNANTCIKLAAYYTIQRHLFGSEGGGGYSFAAPPNSTGTSYTSDTEFGDTIRGLPPDGILALMDELMTTLSVIQPRLYDGVLRKLRDLA